MSENKFDESGSLITDQDFEGESRSFEELNQDERDTYVKLQSDEVAKLNNIITRKSDKVKTLNETLKDEGELDSEGNPVKKEPDADKGGEDVNNSNESERLDRLELRQDGYAPEVIDEIMKIGGKTALDNPIFKQSADALQAQHNAEQASDVTGGPNSTTRTRYSKEDLEGMSSEEMEKVLPHAGD